MCVKDIEDSELLEVMEVWDQESSADPTDGAVPVTQVVNMAFPRSV